MTLPTLPARGLYVITDARLLPDRTTMVSAVDAAIRGGARVVQFRDKSDDQDRRRRQAAAVLDCCRGHGVPMIVNDDVELALAIGADGVHVGAEDAAPAAARRRLGAGAIVGASCYGSVERAVEAVAGGADYVAFGSFHASPTKPESATVPVDVLTAARARLHCPLVAIGGITADNGGALLAAGADMLAVVSAVFACHDDVEGAARRFAGLFET